MDKRNFTKGLAALAVGLAICGLSYWNLIGNSTPISGNAVTVTAVTPGTSASRLGKAEDVAHASGDTGVMGLGVVETTTGGTTSTDGDYAPFTLTPNGAIRMVNVGGDAGTGALVVRDKTATATGTTTLTAAALVQSITCTAGDAANTWIKFYNKATAATSGDTPLLNLVVASNGMQHVTFPAGLAFSAGVSIRAVTTEPDNGNTGATASPSCTITYR